MTAVGSLYTLALPLAAVLMALEATWSSWRRRGWYTARDTAANVAMYAVYFAINVLWAHGLFAVYRWANDHALFRMTFGGWHVGAGDLWWEWVALFVVDDLCFYWFHRASHRVRILWASHVSHHSSERFNLSVAFRQSWVPFLGVVFWLPLAFVGFDPLMIMTMQMVSLFYQELLHTQAVPRLGPLEWIFNTPMHHAVHHGSNPEYLDKNYGGVLIVWDRLFGTFAPATVPVRFGLTTSLDSHNPLVIAFHEWVAMARAVWHAGSWPRAFRSVVGPPTTDKR